jgi:hypothetical protein
MLNKARVDGRERYLVYFLALAMVINHAEFGLVLCLALGVVICSCEVLRKEFLLRKAVAFEAAGFLALVLLVHPFIIAWTQRMFVQSPIMDMYTRAARGIYRLFGTDEEVSAFVKQVVAQPMHLLTDPVALADMTIGATGFPFFIYVGSVCTLGAVFLIIAWLAFSRPGFPPYDKDRDPRWVLPSRTLAAGFAAVGIGLILTGIFWPNTLNSHAAGVAASLLFGALLLMLLILGYAFTKRMSLRVLLILSVFFFVFFAGSLVAGHYFGILGGGAAYRSMGYWGVFASMALMLLLASTEIAAFKALAGGIAILNLIFGASILWTANRGGMETYPKFYPNRTGVIHFSMLTVRDKYDFDYLSLVEPLRRCNLVFMDFKEVGSMEMGRFHAANLMIFLENNHIRFRLGFPYLNAYSLVGDAYHPGFKKEDIGADCVVDQELRNGRVSYRLSVNEWR